MPCPYNQPCANNSDSSGASAVGECVYCERDRLRGEVKELKSLLEFHGPEGHNVTNKQFVDMRVELAQAQAELELLNTHKNALCRAAKDEYITDFEESLYGVREIADMRQQFTEAQAELKSEKTMHKYTYESWLSMCTKWGEADLEIRELKAELVSMTAQRDILARNAAAQAKASWQAKCRSRYIQKLREEIDYLNDKLAAVDAARREVKI